MSNDKKVRFYHTEIEFGEGDENLYLLITETLNSKPIATWHYRIPDEYRTESFDHELERFAIFCPN